jgi:hypothetical protein
VEKRRGPLIATLVGAAVFAIAYDGGAYGLVAWTSISVAVWWVVALGLLTRLFPRRPTPTASLTAGLLATFALLGLASAAWGASAESAFAETNRTLLYVGVFLLVVLSAGRLERWSDGIAAALAAVAFIGLASRFFPGLFSERALPTFLPNANARLSFPLNYWNGLAILLAFAFPLLLRVAVAASRPAVRALAVFPLPAILTAVYLTSSRTGAAAVALGVSAFVLLVDRRWPAAAAAATASAAGGAAILFVAQQDALVNGPLDSGAAAFQGRLSAVVVFFACAAAALVYAFGAARRVRAPSARTGWVLTGAVTAVAVGLLVAAHPVQRWHEFTRPPAVATAPASVQSHLLSAGGNYRWQYWNASVDQWQRHPLLGGGAATFEAWWAKHGAVVGFVQNPHSLYFQVLGELGLVGLVLVLGAFAVGLVDGVRRTVRRSSAGGSRTTTAALTAALAAYVVAVGVDWMWQLPAVSIVGVALLGLLLAGEADGARLTAPRLVRGRRVLAGAAVAACFVVAVAGMDLLTANLKLRDSRAAASRGDVASALDAARTARRIEPWASSPYLQIGLLEEERQALQPALHWVNEALDRNRGDWRVWLIKARIETRLGDVRAGQRSYDHAAALNPRSPIFVKPNA